MNKDRKYNEVVELVLSEVRRPMPEKIGRPVAKVLIVHVPSCTALMQYRRDHQVWEWPGGQVEAGETFRKAAVREVTEETGLNVMIVDAIGTHLVVNDRISHVVQFYGALFTGNRDAAKAEDGFHHKWVTAEEMMDLNVWPAMSESMHRAVCFIDSLKQE